MSAHPLAHVRDRVLVEFPATEGYRGVGRLVLGGLASRFELPVDRLEDLLLAVESLLLQELDGDSVTLDAAAGGDGLHLRLGPFADSRISDPSIERVLTPLVDAVSETAGADGDGVWVELAVAAAWLRDDG